MFSNFIIYIVLYTGVAYTNTYIVNWLLAQTFSLCIYQDTVGILKQSFRLRFIDISISRFISIV